jgi:hypothetical protein
MKKFELNAHNVFTNPEVVFSVNKQHGLSAEIKVAEHEGKWYWGASFQFHSGNYSGSMTPCSLGGESYSTRDAAIVAAATKHFGRLRKDERVKKSFWLLGLFRLGLSLELEKLKMENEH